MCERFHAFSSAYNLLADDMRIIPTDFRGTTAAVSGGGGGVRTSVVDLGEGGAEEEEEEEA